MSPRWTARNSTLRFNQLRWANNYSIKLSKPSICMKFGISAFNLLTRKDRLLGCNWKRFDSPPHFNNKFLLFIIFQKVLKQHVKKEPILQFKFRAKYYPEGKKGKICGKNTNFIAIFRCHWGIDPGCYAAFVLFPSEGFDFARWNLLSGWFGTSVGFLCNAGKIWRLQ